MKRLILLGLMISLLTFGKTERDTKIVNAAIYPSAPIGSSMMIFSSSQSDNMYTKLDPYSKDIVSIEIKNCHPSEIESDTRHLVCDPIKIDGCLYADSSTSFAIYPEDGIFFAYIFENSKSSESNIRYDCVLNAYAETLYLSMSSSSYLFSNFSKLESLDISILENSSANMEGMFTGCYRLTNLDITSLDTSCATNISHMFEFCSSLTELDVSKLRTYNVEKMEYMFGGCYFLSELDVSNFNTSKVTDMSGVFCECKSLTKLDASNFDTSNVTNMLNMFNCCLSLTELDVSHFNTSNVTNMSGMFGSCTKLKKLDLSSFDMTNSCNGNYAYLNSILGNCPSLEYLKSPKALPVDSTTNNSHAITLPDQFSPYSGITALTAGNLADHKVINLPADKFIYEWKTLRTDGGYNGLCAALVEGSYQNRQLKKLIAEYDSFDADYKEYINKAIDKEDVTVGESITYLKDVLAGKQTTENDYGIKKDDVGSYMTISLTEESPYLIAVISLIGILSVVGYYFYNKKKQAN